MRQIQVLQQHLKHQQLKTGVNIVDKYQLLEDSLKVYTDFSELDLEHLKQIGHFIGSSLGSFKALHEAYLDKSTHYEISPRNDEPAQVTFDWEKDKIVIKRYAMEVKFDSTLFLRYMNLIDICYIPILPVGSVVEVDLQRFPEGLKQMYEKNNEPAPFFLAEKHPHMI